MNLADRGQACGQTSYEEARGWGRADTPCVRMYTHTHTHTHTGRNVSPMAMHVLVTAQNDIWYTVGAE